MFNVQAQATGTEPLSCDDIEALLDFDQPAQNTRGPKGQQENDHTRKHSHNDEHDMSYEIDETSGEGAGSKEAAGSDEE